MSTFAYTAIARDGKRTNGTLTADSRAAAITQVTRQGLHPVKVDEQRGGKSIPAVAKVANGNGTPAKSAPAKAPVLPYANGKAAARDGMRKLFSGGPARVGRVPQRAVESFTRELANLLSGGVSLARALSLLRRETSNPAAKQLWNDIHDDVIGGTALGDAMAKFPKAFSTVYVAMVRAGESGGFLDVVLQQIADFRTREADLKGKVKAAMIYPFILACMSVLVVTFLLTFFIPKFSTIFDQFHGNLPYLTQCIIAVSDVMKQYGLYVLGGLVVLGFFLRRSLQTDVGKRRLEQVMLSVPVLGRVTAHFALVRFCRMLGTLVGSGVPLVSSLRTAREAIGNQTLADTVSHAIDEVQRGEALSKSLGESPKLFPASVVETIAVAEETGRLDKELVRLAAAYEGDLDRQLRMLVAVAEPALLFVMAGLIGTIVVGMLLPVFKLQEAVQ
jgi:type II secretory pathway component PulF